MSKLFWFPAGLSTMYIYQNMSHDQLVMTAGIGVGLAVSSVIILIMALSRQTERRVAIQIANSNVALASRVSDLEHQLGDALDRLSRLNGHGMAKRRRASMRRKAA